MRVPVHGRAQEEPAEGSGGRREGHVWTLSRSRWDREGGAAVQWHFYKWVDKKIRSLKFVQRLSSGKLGSKCISTRQRLRSCRCFQNGCCCSSHCSSGLHSLEEAQPWSGRCWKFKDQETGFQIGVGGWYGVGGGTFLSFPYSFP